MPELAADAVVLDLDNTLVKLEVDWPAVGRRLAVLARSAGMDARDSGIWALLEEARRAGRAGLRAEMEQLLTDAEMAGAGGPYNSALVGWLDRHAAAVPLSVLSLNSRAAVLHSLERNGLAGRVAHVVGREDVSRIKPDPEGMHTLASRHAVEPERMLLVGDKDTDRQCAEAAGARFLHVDEVGVEWRRPGS